LMACSRLLLRFLSSGCFLPTATFRNGSLQPFDPGLKSGWPKF
jgi:hypothetical protein